MADNVIEARGLLKLYGSHRAVDAIDLEIHRGEIFGLLGPNGAGKTTAILMMLGLTEISGGSVEVLGSIPCASRSRSSVASATCRTRSPSTTI